MNAKNVRKLRAVSNLLSKAIKELSIFGAGEQPCTPKKELMVMNSAACNILNACNKLADVISGLDNES